MYNKLQYISQGSTREEQILNIKRVLDHGCTWVQLRFKNQSDNNILSLADEIRLLTAKYRSTLIINDHINIARDVDADGVHLGLQDADVSQARSALGNNKLIGGTANTIQHIYQRFKEQCNYIGLGPFGHTQTKEKLSPILGLAGYRKILSQLKDEETRIPVYAIGGIQVEDIDDILNTGIYGVAISGALTHSTQNLSIIQSILSNKYENFNDSRSGI